MYEIMRHGLFGDTSLVEDGDMDYFDSKSEAEKVASELTEIYKVDDGHPWSGDKFYAQPVSDEVIESRRHKWAMQRAFAEMGGEY